MKKSPRSASAFPSGRTFNVIGGQSALANQAGVAVLQDGTWKVGLASFCGLLALENGGKTSGLPAACKSAG